MERSFVFDTFVPVFILNSKYGSIHAPCPTTSNLHVIFVLSRYGPMYFRVDHMSAEKQVKITLAT